MKSLLYGTSQVLLAIAGFSFFVGGRAINAITKIDRMSAEVVGIGIAVVFGIFGVVARRAGDYLDDDEKSGSAQT